MTRLSQLTSSTVVQQTSPLSFLSHAGFAAQSLLGQSKDGGIESNEQALSAVVYFSQWRGKSSGMFTRR